MKKIIAALLIAAFCFTLAASVAEADVSRGDRGQEVTEVQYVLRSFGYVLAVDGVFGAQTDKAVRHFQKVNGLRTDGIVGPVTSRILTAATAASPATRVNPPAPPPSVEVGIQGKPFAPQGLDICAEMNFYRTQWGLPDRFSDQPRKPAVDFWDQGLGWRESGCRNDVGNWCCGGYWANYITSHLSSQSAYREPIINQCQVRGMSDIRGTSALSKQKQACVTAVVFFISGLSPWRPLS